MKKFGITFPCFYCFGEDGEVFICSGTFFSVKGRFIYSRPGPGNAFYLPRFF